MRKRQAVCPTSEAPVKFRFRGRSQALFVQWTAPCFLRTFSSSCVYDANFSLSCIPLLTVAEDTRPNCQNAEFRILVPKFRLKLVGVWWRYNSFVCVHACVLLYKIMTTKISLFPAPSTLKPTLFLKFSTNLYKSQEPETGRLFVLCFFFQILGPKTSWTNNIYFSLSVLSGETNLPLFSQCKTIRKS